MLPTSEIKQRLKMAFWDYNYTADELYDVLYHDVQIGYLTKARIYQRLLETFSWYKILELIPREKLGEMLTDEIIQRLRFKWLQIRYQHVRELLP